MTAPKPTPRLADEAADAALDMVFPTAAANDDFPAPFGPFDGAETMLTIEFIGFTADESHRALASFGGGRRCVLLHA